VALQQEYNNLHNYLQTGEDRGLYSASKQQADRFFQEKGIKYPLSIRNDLIRLEHNPSTVTEYWVRIPVKAVKGALWIGLIKPYELIPTDGKVCESKLYRRDDKWWINVTVEREIPERTNYQNVIAIDLRIHHIACIELPTSNGQSLNQVRGHYFWLRRQLAKKGLQKVIKKIGDHESRILVDIMHKITSDLALETNSLLVPTQYHKRNWKRGF
jgi:transposase